MDMAVDSMKRDQCWPTQKLAENGTNDKIVIFFIKIQCSSLI